jgi:hypothetical protein
VRVLTGIDVSKSQNLELVLLECFLDFLEVRSSPDRSLDLSD